MQSNLQQITLIKKLPKGIKMKFLNQTLKIKHKSDFRRESKMDNKEFFAAFDDLCKEKGIGREEFIETLKNALNSAYKKQYDDG